jgi:hypothetical protein
MTAEQQYPALASHLAEAARQHNIAERARRRNDRIMAAAQDRTEPVTPAAAAHPQQHGQRLDLTTEHLGAIDDALMLLHLQGLAPEIAEPAFEAHSRIHMEMRRRGFDA